MTPATGFRSRESSTAATWGTTTGRLATRKQLSVDVTMNRRQFRTDFGFRGLGFLFDEAEFTVRYADYDQDEIETFEASGEEIVATHFDNRSVVFRGELRKPAGRVHSRVGVWGNVRDYEAWGHEALAPETRQNAFAAFTYNEIEANERLDLLLGARAERNAYDVGEDTNPLRPAPVVDRTFLTASASTGARLAVGGATALVGVASLATRAPSLEELYNFGPHIGNLAYEIGNPELDQERSLGFDLSLRQSSEALTGSLSVFRYDISNFVFGEVLGGRISGLPVWLFQQSDATYQGFEAEGHVSLGTAELVTNAAYVDAKLANGEYVPRIPPLGGQVKLDVPVGKLRLAPRLRWAVPDGPPLPGRDPDRRLRGVRLHRLLRVRRRAHDAQRLARRLQHHRRRVQPPQLADQGHGPPDGPRLPDQLLAPVLLGRSAVPRPFRAAGAGLKTGAPAP